MNRLIVGSPDKTDFLLQFLAEDFQNGVTVIDPTGAFALAAANTVPLKLTEQVIYLDPTDMGYPVGFNVLEHVLPDHRQPLTEQICAYFEAMWPNGWGAQSNYLLANCLRILLDTPGSTLLGVLKLLSDKSYRIACLSHCTDPVVLKNWSLIEAWDAKQFQAAIAPLQNKIGTLLMSPMIRHIVGQPHSTMGARIIIANLDRARIGDLTAKLLGGLLIARSTGQVYINDVGFFALDYLASLLPQNRFTLSLRSLSQLKRTALLADEILGIDEKIVLRVNRSDAEELAFYVGLMNPRSLMELASNEARTVDGFMEPELPPSQPRLKALRKRTRACHTRPRAKVEAQIRAFLG
jgi:hypothetical protein